ncbi:MAG: macro domain-containing protein [Hyphomonadaceae bacterium]
MPIKFEVSVGRIEALAVDAIVNAANRALIPGGGVDGAIRRAAGPELDQLLATHGGLPEGRALTTPGFKTRARFIIHTVAPIYFASDDDDWKERTLAECYASCIAEAHEAGVSTIAFPAIGTGAFGWPKEMGRDIALRAIRAAAQEQSCVERVVFCCFSEEDAALYRAALDR